MNKTLIIAALFTLLGLTTVAQETGIPQSSFSSEPHTPPILLNYLFDTYGIEASEEICLSIQTYELNHKVKVLHKTAYAAQIEQIDKVIANTNNPIEARDLNNQKTRLVNFSTIENTIIHL